MSIIDEALSANATIANDYDPGRGGPPAPKIAIVTCADPRLTSIEQMLGLAAGDVDMIRNFGTVIDDDAGPVARSLDQAAGHPGDHDHQSHRLRDAQVYRQRAGGPAPQADGAGADCAGQVLQLHRPREEHQGADPQGQVASVDLAGGTDQGVRI